MTRKVFAAAVAAIAAAVFLTLPSSAATLSPGTYYLDNPVSLTGSQVFIEWRLSSLPDTGALVGRIKDGSKTYNMYLVKTAGYYQARLTRQSGEYSIQNRSASVADGVTVSNANLGNLWEIIIYSPPTTVANKFSNAIRVPELYPGVQLSIIDHRINWTTPQHSGTLLNYEVLRYDDDSIIATLPADTTSYQPLYSDRIYIKTYYETPEGDGVEANSNDVDYIAYYPGVVITQDGYRISWDVPTGYPDLAEIKGYIIYIDGVQAGVTQQPNTLIVQGGTYEVQVQYQGTTRSTLSNGITYTPTAEDQLPMINNQLTLIREMIGGYGDTSGIIQQLMDKVDGLAQEETLQSVHETLTLLYESVLSHYDGQDPATQAVIEKLDNVSQAIDNVSETILPELQHIEVDISDLDVQIASIASSMQLMAPVSGMFFGNSKVALYILICIVLVVGMAVLRHGVD